MYAKSATASHSFRLSALSALIAAATVAAPCAAQTVAALEPVAPPAALSIGDAEWSAIYADRGFAPIWLGQGRAEALISALGGAAAHALPASRYGVDALRARLAALPSDPAARLEVDVAFTRAFLLYARDLSSGVLEPSRIASLIKVEPPRPDPLELLRAAAQAPDMAAHLAALAPADPAYAPLQRAFAAMTARAAAGDWGARLPEGPTLRPGDRDARVRVLRARLAAMGDAAAAGADAQLFDATLADAVRRFQARHGLIEDGAVGDATRAAINVSAAFRAGQIAVNLERMRWMNRPLGERHIVVNQPAFTVTLVENGKALFHERVVIGRTVEQTPEFSDEMRFLVLNPTWHVPRSIATQDLLPALQRDPTVLAQRSMRLVRTDGGQTPADPSQHDFSVYSASNFPYRIRQAPSAGNALGKVKFMFPNGDNIYLHDTPRKELFNKDERAFSWGCVRVRDPLRLAELLLAPQDAAPAALIERLLATGRERQVDLEATVPVHLVYRTAWIDGTGALQLRGDVYGRDALALRALRALGVAAPDV